MNKLSTWTNGLIATAVTGLGNGITLVVTDHLFDVFKDSTGLYKAVIATTLISVGAYLKQSPIPLGKDKDDEPSDPPPTGRSPVVLTALLLCSSLLLSSCAFLEEHKASIRPALAAVGTGYVLSASTEAEQNKRADGFASLAAIVRTIQNPAETGGIQFRDALNVVAPSMGSDWKNVASTLFALYSSFLQSSATNSGVMSLSADQITESAAKGLEDVAASRATPATAN